MIIWRIYYICEKDKIVQNNSNIAVPYSGMNRDKHPQDLSPFEYSFALNATIEGDDGSQIKIQNEPSTLLCKRFDGYKVIGYKNDIAGDNTYFFLVNPDNNTSKITFMRSLDYVKTVEDQLAGSGKDIHRILGERLEESDGRFDEICDLMEVLIEDGTDDPCLNFSIHHPIFDIEIKDEKCGKVIYWTDGYNPQRYVMVDKALNPDDDGDFWYHYHGYKTCGDDKPIERCRLACEKLLVFPLLTAPCVEPEVVEFGGSLRAGTYQFCVALCDEFGIEKTGYCSLTNPIMLFDRQDMVIRDGLWGKSTNMGIRLTVSNIDKQVSHYKIGVIQNTVGFNGEQSPVLEYFIEGIHPITERTIYYLTDQYSERTTMEKLSKEIPVYKTARGMTSVGNRLLQYGLTVENEWNLQPVVNFLGHFVKWQTSIATENLYKDGVACSKYASFMRDEVYPLGIRFFTNTGYRTARFPLIPRPATREEMEVIVDEDGNSEDLSAASVLENNPQCAGNSRRYLWQFKNTAKIINDPSWGFDDFGGECKNQLDVKQLRYVEQEYATVGETQFVINTMGEDVTVDDAIDYIADNIENLCDIIESNVGITDELCAAISLPEDQDGIKAPDFSSGCDDIERIETRTILDKNSLVDSRIDFTYKLASDYVETEPTTLIQSNAESQRKFSVLCDFDNYSSGGKNIIDLVQEWLDGQDEDKFPSDIDSSAMVLCQDMSNVRQLYDEGICTNGCSVGDPHVNPTINDVQLPTFQGGRSLGKCTYLYQYPGWEGKKHTETMLDQLMDTMEAYFPQYESQFGIENAMCLFGDGDNSKFNTGITTDWEGRVSMQNDIDAKTNWFGRSNLTYFKFYPHVSSYARWVELDYEKYISGLSDPDNGIMYIEMMGNYNYPIGDSSSYNKVRITFFSDKEGTVAPNPLANDAKKGVIVNYVDHKIFMMPKYLFWNDDKTTFHKIYVCIEPAVCVFFTGFAMRQDMKELAGFYTAGTAIFPAPFCFGIRPLEVKYVFFFTKELKLRRFVTYEAKCISCGDKPADCAPRPYQYGDFGYWESTNKYPANFELYDSSKIGISSGGSKRKDIIDSLMKYYGSPKSVGGKSYFTGNGGNAEYPNTSTTFCQRPIRHYKFPDNSVAPFMGNPSQLTGQYGVDSYIYPMGVMLDDDIVNEFLDIAVENGLIDKARRDSIIGYELYRGDRTLDKSVIGTGLAYDMFKYDDPDGSANLYPNYPYNDLSDDMYIYKDINREKFITHPFNRRGNIWYSFLSPDIAFNKPDAPTECLVDGYQLGKSSGIFREVEDHPKWTILGSKAYSMATSLATVEAMANLISAIAEYTYQSASQQYVGGGVFFLANPVGIALTAIRLATGIAKATAQSVVDIGKYRYQWLTALIDRGPRRNYAYYYTSVAHYNLFYQKIGASELRGLSTAKYIKSGLYPVTDISSQGGTVGGKPIIINNLDREHSLFMSFGMDKYMLEYPELVSSYDTSRIQDECNIRNDEVAGMTPHFMTRESFVSCPYMRIKKYSPAQYGQIEDIRWVSLGGCGLMDENKRKPVFGGDVFISRFSIKRKMPMFYLTQFGQGDMIPFPYYDYRNIGYPRYFVNYDTGEDYLNKTDTDTGSLYSFPSRKSAYEMVCKTGDMYLSGRFFLYFYGIPQFLVESEINCNFRIAGPEPYEGFYPEVGDYISWTQERNVPISRDNVFKMSPVYKNRFTLGGRSLPETYDSNFWDCAYQRPNGVIWSTADVSENGMTDPWLSYKPMDYHEFKTSFGKLISMKGIESDQILARFENQVGLYNAIDVLAERISPENSEIGTGGLFASRGIEYNNTTLGYSGTQSRDMISCEFGHFWVDLRRGQVFKVDSNGRNLTEVTPGLRNWFKEHLQMKIIRSRIYNADTDAELSYYDIDNKFFGIGLSMGWDNRFKRVLITKKDYIPVGNPSEYQFRGGRFYRNGQAVELQDASHFTDVSFTVGYNCLKGEWKSYLSYTPDYYIEHQHYFQSGKNYSSESQEIGLWSHGLTNQSYQVFYGKLYPFVIEVPVREQYVNKILTNYQYRMDARRYQDEVNYQILRTTGFNKAWFYNDTNNSGELRMVIADKNDMSQRLRYPVTNDDSREILVTEVDQKININDYFNEVKDDTNNLPVWIKDVNDIDRKIDPRAVDYHRRWRDRLRGDWFLARFVNDIESRFKMIVRWFSNDEKIY